MVVNDGAQRLYVLCLTIKLMAGPRTVRTRTAVSVLAVSAVAACTTGTPSDVDDTQHFDRRTTTVVTQPTPGTLGEAVKRDLGLSLDEYQRQGNLAAAASDWYATTSGTDLAGMWIEKGEVYVAATTVAGQSAIAAAGYIPVAVEHTADELASAYADALRWQHADPSRGVETTPAIYIDPARNGIVAISTVAPATRPPALTIFTGTLPPAGEQTGSPPPSAPPRPGAAIYTSDVESGAMKRCTLGATGYTHTDVPVAMTAAHCAPPGSKVFTDDIANVGMRQLGQTSVTSAESDVAVITLPAPVEPGVRAYSAPTPLVMTGKTRPVIGAPVCQAGAVSGYTCGTVTATNTELPVVGRAALPSVFLSDLCSLGGDSGSPLVQGYYLIGITNTSTWGNSNACPPRNEQRNYITISSGTDIETMESTAGVVLVAD